MPHDIPRGIPHEGCGGTFILSRKAIQGGLWGHLKCDKCGALADTLQMGIDPRDMPEWDTDLPRRDTRPASKWKRIRTRIRKDPAPPEGGAGPTAKMGRTHSGPHYVGCGCAGDSSTTANAGRTQSEPREPEHTKYEKYYDTVNGRYARPKPSSSRRLPVALAVALMAVAVLGGVWWSGFDPADVGDVVLGGIGDLSEHGGAALDGISDVALDGLSDVAGGASVALDGISDAAREAADMMEESRSDILAAGGDSVADTPASPLGHIETPMADPVVESVVEPDEPPTDMQDTPPPSPFDRTIWPDDTAHDSRQGAQEAEPIPPMQSGPEAGTETVPQPTKTEQIEELIHTMTNQHREAAGLQPLDRITKIDQIARAHSEDMAERNYFEHDTPEGLDPSDRGNAAGYPCRKDHGSYYTYGLAENISMHTGTWYGAERLANEIMKGWMNSFGHRQNIMESDYDRIGVGVAIGGGAVYATQNFC